MSNNITFNLNALIESIEKIKLYSQDFDNADTFYHDQKSFDASMMQFVVIGEIISRLDENFKTSHSEIPWQKIKDFRNIIAHDYFGIDADEIWDIINNKLLPLKNDIKKLLSNGSDI
ncbi:MULTISPECIES: HepT-like ribonuclease domain-containing protein [unclassified Sulfuricurvum]|uniref:HepT-like ribonuclease domain-containing protein n=1 Tax=unclassified Sulfuricurvum TaxID=2632390 RepID=UPI0002998FF1|nr:MULTISPECIES: HepT-like ribonuclease domain-containing protein [unclassified Sulfuricurvum]AFV98229.1 hypothetical protein B649_09585 [Candidatus Sulfuricurvum sp. RIFRC-1]HBM34759.1 DUF86 domain-containing protein [Sulfuricurvum sp.]